MPNSPAIAAAMLNAYQTLYLITLLLCALIAGLLRAYACSVNPGLARLSDAEYLRAMQGINIAILNPVFFLSFMGTLLALPLCAWMSYRYGTASGGRGLLAAAALYAVGVFGVTALGNVPLNNKLAAIDISASTPAQLSVHRDMFEGPWNRYHTVRTLCSVMVFILAAFPLLRRQ